MREGKKKTVKPSWFGPAAVALTLIGLAPLDAFSRTDSMTLASSGAKPPSAIQRAPTPYSPREHQPLVVSGTAPHQAGYVHYFIITGPDGEPESHVGIELPGNRIAWSFPEVGVTIVPFMKSGVLHAGGKPYEVEYLYGLRPPGDEESLRTLQRSVAERVAWWVEEKIPFCDEARPYNRLCVSCLGFVLRVLYPSASPGLPALPADFRSARKNVYTTEDLLLYLAGVRIDVPRETRAKYIAALDVPPDLREELARLAVESPEASATAVNEAPRPAVAKPRATGRSLVNSPRRLATKRGS